MFVQLGSVTDVRRRACIWAEALVSGPADLGLTPDTGTWPYSLRPAARLGRAAAWTRINAETAALLHASRRLAALARRRLEMLDGVGHMPQVEAPGRFVAVLERFLADSEPSQRDALNGAPG